MEQAELANKSAVPVDRLRGTEQPWFNRFFHLPRAHDALLNIWV